MKYLIIKFSLIISVSLLLFFGCEQSNTVTIPDDLISNINKFYKAIEDGDTKARIDMFTNDAMMLPNHWTSFIGKEAISELINNSEGVVFKIRDREIIDISISGNLAYTVNSYYYTYHPIENEPQWHKTKNVHIWKKTEDGNWKLHLDIWNSDVPISQFPNE